MGQYKVTYFPSKADCDGGRLNKILPKINVLTESNLAYALATSKFLAKSRSRRSQKPTFDYQDRLSQTGWC